MKLVSLGLLSSALFLVACGGDDGGVTITPDAEDGPDAETNVTCLATASYGAATAAGQQGFYDMMVAPTQLSLLGSLNADALPDVLDIELFKGFGAFTTGEIRTGTFPITGAEADFATCGVCALLVADVDAQGAPAQTYLATSGSMTITAVSPNLTGTLTNAGFVHVEIADDGSGTTTFLNDGCDSTITSVAFDAVLMAAQ